MTAKTKCYFAIKEGFLFCFFFYRREQPNCTKLLQQVISMSDTFGGGAPAFFKGTSHVPTLEATDNYDSQLLVGAFQKAIIYTEY